MIFLYFFDVRFAEMMIELFYSNKNLEKLISLSAFLFLSYKVYPKSLLKVF